MIIKALEKEWDINDCTYKERREIHAKNAKVWWNDNQDIEAYYDLLERVSDIAGFKEKDFEGLDMVQIDLILQTVFMEYLGLSKKTVGD